MITQLIATKKQRAKTGKTSTHKLLQFNKLQTYNF